MATHQNIRYLQQRASQNGLVIHLGSLHFKAKKNDIEELLKEHGFDKCTFFWPDMPPNQPGEHKGWCRVQFAEKKIAESAKSALQNMRLMGRPIKIGSIENTAVSTDQVIRWLRITLLLMLPRLLLKHQSELKPTPRQLSSRNPRRILLHRPSLSLASSFKRRYPSQYKLLWGPLLLFRRELPLLLLQQQWCRRPMTRPLRRWRLLGPCA
jgi:hypothetical protein